MKSKQVTAWEVPEATPLEDIQRVIDSEHQAYENPNKRYHVEQCWFRMWV